MAPLTTNVSTIVSEIDSNRAIYLIKIIAALGKAIMAKWIVAVICLVKEITANPLRLVQEINMKIAA
jgi:hypothetical protein